MSRSIPVLGRLRDLITASFRRKLATALFGVFLVVSLAMLGLSVQVDSLLDENVEQSMTAAASAEAGELNEWNSQYRLLARVLSEHPVYESGDDDAIRTHLQSQRAAKPDVPILRTYVIDRRNQTVVTSPDRDLEGKQISELPWQERFSFRDFDDVQTTRPFESEDGTTAIGFIAPIRRLPGALLVVEIETASVFDRFEHPVDGGFTSVVNSNGTVVFADGPAPVLTQYNDRTQRAPIVSRGLRGERGFTESPSYERTEEETAYVAAYAPVTGTDWVVIEHAPVEEAYAIARQAQLWIAGITVFTLGALVVVVGVLGTDVETALSRLTDRARRIERGEYDVQFETDRADEFGDLNRTIASTRGTLVERIEQLRQTKADLETSNRALEERSTMVNVLNRILRHNVRNDVNVIAGRTEVIADQVDEDAVQTNLAVIDEAAWKLAELSTRTQRIEQLLSDTETETAPLQVEGHLSSALAEIDDTAAGVTVTLEYEAPVSPVEATQLVSVALADVVGQIAAHNDGPVRIEVTISEEATEDHGDVVVVRIDDDGEGLPELDVHAVDTGEETPLNHAEGLALWCLEWTVSKADGTLNVDPNDATLVARLPVSAEPAAPDSASSKPS